MTYVCSHERQRESLEMQLELAWAALAALQWIREGATCPACHGKSTVGHATPCWIEEAFSIQQAAKLETLRRTKEGYKRLGQVVLQLYPVLIHGAVFDDRHRATLMLGELRSVLRSLGLLEPQAAMPAISPGPVSRCSNCGNPVYSEQHLRDCEGEEE